MCLRHMKSVLRTDCGIVLFANKTMKIDSNARSALHMAKPYFIREAYFIRRSRTSRGAAVLHTRSVPQEKPPLCRRQFFQKCSSSADSLAGFGTLQMQVAGLHRAGPSATLDKAMKLYHYFTRFFRFVKGCFCKANPAQLPTRNSSADP